VCGAARRRVSAGDWVPLMDALGVKKADNVLGHNPFWEDPRAV
jgi:hypothetical protein